MLKQVSVHGGHEWYAVGGMDGEVGMVSMVVDMKCMVACLAWKVDMECMMACLAWWLT